MVEVLGGCQRSSFGVPVTAVATIVVVCVSLFATLNREYVALAERDHDESVPAYCLRQVRLSQ